MYAAIGPAVTVMGASSAESTGIVVFHMPLTPTGAFIAVVNNGFSPEASEWGNQVSHQMNKWESTSTSPIVTVVNALSTLWCNPSETTR